MVDNLEGSSPKSTTPMNCWSSIDKDILESVLDEVSLADKLNCRGVCRNWCLIARNRIADLLSRIEQPPPLLVLEEKLERKYRQIPARETKDHSTMKALQMETIRKYCSIPTTETIDHLTMKAFEMETIVLRVEESIKGSWFYSLKDDKFLKLNDKCELLKMSSCVGSTNNWLIFVQNEGSDQMLFLYNPLLDIGIHPSPPLALPTGYRNVILCGDPITTDGYNFSVVVITEESVMFARRGDQNWTLLDSGCYVDVIACKNYVYALTEASAIQAWDFSGSSPVNVLNVKPSLKETIVGDLMGDDVSKQWLPRPFFLVELNGELLIVSRYCVCIPSPDPRLTYMTASHFCLYKLDLEEVKWVEDSLGDRVIFLGKGQCVSSSAKDFPGYDKGIYCADHQLTHLTDDYHKIGEKERWIELPEFWLVPPRLAQNTVI